jgi:hypothetical protein
MGPLFVVLLQPIVHDLPDFDQPTENIEVQHLMAKGPVVAVYGRTARLLEPFLCLAGGWFTARFLASEGCGRTRLAASWAVLLALGGHNMQGPFSLVFKDRFEKAINARYGKFRTMPTFAIRETGVLAPEPPSCPEATIAREALPTSYMPYRYEGTSQKLRAFMATQPHEYVFFKCRFDLHYLDVDFTNGKVPADVATSGLGEMSLHGDKEALWAMGPDTVLEFWEHGGRKSTLSFTLLGVVAPALDVEVWINGVRKTFFALEREDGHPGEQTISIVFNPLVGLNQVRFHFSKWNGMPERYIASDPRPFAVALRSDPQPVHRRGLPAGDRLSRHQGFGVLRARASGQRHCRTLCPNPRSRPSRWCKFCWV